MIGEPNTEAVESQPSAQTGNTEREKRLEWMAVWAAKNGLRLSLNGTCGFGRECVGVTIDGHYPDYTWSNEDFERIDPNGDVWTPPDAYHKHDCVAVLGRGEEAERQLYEWLRWFDANGFKLETGASELPKDDSRDITLIRVLMGQHRYARLVRQGSGVLSSQTATDSPLTQK